MTTEPKFVPNEAAEIVLDENVQLKVRLVDCVGYLVKGALGHLENNAPRMVTTPWFDYQIPFEEAAEMGTKKVINEHSTIGLVVITDGSITEIPREEYIEAEERVINELKKINKPFVIILNSTKPEDYETLRLKDELQKKYSTPVINANCAQLRIDDINNIMERVLFEFPVSEIGINIPKWIESLDDGHWLKSEVIASIKETYKDVRKIREVKAATAGFDSYDFIKKAAVDRINLGEGDILVDLSVSDGLFYRILSESTGLEIEGEHKLMSLMQDWQE